MLSWPRPPFCCVQEAIFKKNQKNPKKLQHTCCKLMLLLCKVRGKKPRLKGRIWDVFHRRVTFQNVTLKLLQDLTLARFQEAQGKQEQSNLHVSRKHSL